jgi:SAM-dependent methyltransferase
MWDKTFDTDEYVYGEEPNTFLEGNFAVLPKGRVLCLAEGEGRNAVFLARQGYEVTGVDSSSVGLAKGRRLADRHGVAVDWVHADLANYVIGQDQWEAVVSIFCHLPPDLRRHVYGQIVPGLRTGGVLLLEGYTVAQLKLGTGGPPVAKLMLSKDIVQEEFSGLEFDRLEDLERDVTEGTLHRGIAAVVQAVGIKSKKKSNEGDIDEWQRSLFGAAAGA